MKLRKDHFMQTIKITKIAALSIGILVYNRGTEISTFKKIFSKVYYRFCLYFLAVAVFGEIVDLFASFSVNFLAVTNVLPCICYCMISLCKFVSMAANVEKSEKLLHDLEDLWTAEELEASKIEMITENMTKGKQAQISFTILTFMFGFTCDISPFVVMIRQYVKTGEVVKTLPYLIYMPWDTTGPFTYPLSYLINLISSSIAFVGFIASDTFFVATIFHICTQFKVLRFKILCIVEGSLPADLYASLDINHNFHENMYDALIECIKRHSELITLTHTLEEIFSVSILLNFINSSIIICCVGFNSTAVTGVDLAVSITFFAMSLYQIYTLCWAGNYLIDTSSKIADAAYNSSWYLTDRRYRQLIHIIILRAQRPQVVTALRFSVISFKSFSSILKSSYSYFTLLQTSYSGK